MKTHPIFYVEDGENEVLLLRHAFEAAEIPNPLHVVRDGQQAMTYLSGASMFRNGEAECLPRLVLLDLHLPGMSGLEVLEWIRGQPALPTLVVIIFSSSQDPRELARAYRLRANSFIFKSPDLGRRLEFARLQKAWWLDYNQVPQREEVSSRVPEDGLTGHKPLMPDCFASPIRSVLPSSRLGEPINLNNGPNMEVSSRTVPLPLPSKQEQRKGIDKLDFG